jgi:6-phosphofructokinase 1
MATLSGNAVIGQSGGPTSVINQSLVGVVLELQKLKHAGKVLGAKHGVRGIINDQYYDLTAAPADLLERVAKTPAAALGSTRDKPDPDYCEKIFANFQKNNVHYFFYIGGNDSADTARIVDDLAKKAGYDLRVYHIPKTIDNDLRVHDHTPGYGSAARYVASAIIGDNFDNASLPGIKIDVIMGRNAGFLTAAAALGRKYETDGPHLIYVPEAPLTEDRFLADVDAVYSRLGRCLIAVSEGLSTPDGKTWTEGLLTNLDKDAHGNIQLAGTGALADGLSNLITKKLNNPGGKKLRVRGDTFGYPQRSFPGYTSGVDATEARLVGTVAAKSSAQDGTAGTSIAMRRKPGATYAIETFLTPLSTVARETKHMPADFLQNGNNVTQAFLDYARPLIGTLPEVGSLSEL